MPVAIINDCRDSNARIRQEIMTARLFPGEHIGFCGVQSELEAAGNIVDTLHVFGGEDGVILANKAPRDGDAKQWENGPPFGFFRHGETLVVSSIGGSALSLVKKLELTDEINEVDIRTVIGDVLRGTGESPDLARGIIKSQFRSMEFTPRLAAVLSRYGDDYVESIPFSIAEVPDAPLAAWGIDIFGNIKTTLLPEDIGYDPEEEPNMRVYTELGQLTCYPGLALVPDEEIGLTIGSSGLGDRKFMEVVIQGGRAADHFKVPIGEVLLDRVAA